MCGVFTVEQALRLAENRLLLGSRAEQLACGHQPSTLHYPLFRASLTSIHTARISTAPRAFNFVAGSSARRDMPLIRHAMINAPQRTPSTVPRPPFNEAPPITHAATASSSMSSPTVVVLLPW